MKVSDTTDLLFLKALSAIDSGDAIALDRLINAHPYLVRERFVNGSDDYFTDPYLLWFVADNPIRTSKLPLNIIKITSLLIDAVIREAPVTCQVQIDYALYLVVSGCIVRDCGVQISMMDLLIDAGASPNCGMAALSNGNIEAALYLTQRGGAVSLTLAACTENLNDIVQLITGASRSEKLTSIAAAAYYGKAEIIKYLLVLGTDPNGYPEAITGFHSHATPLHQAVSSGSFESVKLLTEAGAKLFAVDKIYNGTPLDWAIYLRSDQSQDQAKREKFLLIEEFLKTYETPIQQLPEQAT